ncbi:MAG: LytTR family transcriptional regulator DNA-binding domain-containing protein [Flavobacteriales bacterium]|nr:LytTR family transcriptional regulator DNA-binding domain-containing protein [Flavobacteriales bacterium]
MNRNVRIVVVEDDAVIAADLAALLGDLGYTVSATCPNARTAMLALARHEPDLLLLDIQLGQGADGVRIAQEVNGTRPIPIIFVTSHTDPGTLERVKSVRPAGFIIKPFDEADLRTQIEIALARYAAQADATEPMDEAVQQDFVIADNLFVRHHGRLVKVPVDDIRFVQADGNYVLLHTDERRYALTTTLTAMEQKLPERHFVRVHRSYLVDLRKITAVEEKRVLLGKDPVPVGRTHREALRRRLDLR